MTMIHGFHYSHNGRYYLVEGEMPLHLAEEMYYENGELGRYQIRVSGHCGCPPPHHWCYSRGGEFFVTSYHIDSDEAFEIFKLYAEAASKYKPFEDHVSHDARWAIRTEYTKRKDRDDFRGWSIR